MHSKVLLDGQNSLICSVLCTGLVLVGLVVKVAAACTASHKSIIGSRGLRCHWEPVSGVTHSPLHRALQVSFLQAEKDILVPQLISEIFL